MKEKYAEELVEKFNEEDYISGYEAKVGDVTETVSLDIDVIGEKEIISSVVFDWVNVNVDGRRMDRMYVGYDGLTLYLRIY